MADRVELAFRRAAETLIGRDRVVLVAVSGGGDSIALLHLLHGFERGHRIELVVGHLDHGLRPGSAGDRRFVEGEARRLALPCVAERRQVGRLRRKDESPEEAARRVRREFLVEAASGAGCSLIATGHTLDDQAETVLMRMLRGSGATSLAGMSPAGPGPFVRPLLGLERAELRAYLARRRLGHVEDPTNEDPRFERNRIRAAVMPLLAERINPRAARHLVRAADRLREDARYLDDLARRALDELCAEDPGGRLVLDARPMAGLPEAVASRVSREALRRAGIDARRIAARHVEALLDLARGAGSREVCLPGRRVARRVRRQIVFE